MQAATPAHDFLLPRLRQLVADAQAQGIGRDAVVAVMIDIVTGSTFNAATPDPADDTEAASTHDVALTDYETGVDDREAHPEDPLRGQRLLAPNFRIGRRGRRL